MVSRLIGENMEAELATQTNQPKRELDSAGKCVLIGLAEIAAWVIVNVVAQLVPCEWLWQPAFSGPLLSFALDPLPSLRTP